MSKTKKKSSLVVKFARISAIVTGATALILSAVFILSTTGVIQRQAVSGTVESVGALRNELLDRIDKWGSLVELTTIAAAGWITPGGLADPAGMQTMLARRMATQDDISLLYVSSTTHWEGPGGFTVFDRHVNLPVGWPNTERPWFVAAMAAPGRIAFTDPYIDVVTGNLAISISKIIYDNYGRGIGVASGDVGLAFLNAMLEEKAAMPGHRLTLIDRQGRFIAHPDPAAVLTRDFFAEHGFERYRAGVLASPSFLSHSGGTFVYSELIPGVDWILVSTIPSAAIFSEVNSFIRNMVIIVAALLAAAVFVSIWFTRKELAVPIRGISGVAEAIAGMDFSVSIAVTENDEIGDMQEAMIKIRDNLKQGIEGIRDASAEAQKKMEAAVKERMQAIIDSAPMLCAIYDGDGNALEVNKEAEEMFGISDRKIFATRFNDFLPPRQPDGSDSMQKSAETIRIALRDGQSRNEWMYRHRDGTPLPTEEIMTRIELDGETRVISYSRDLRESHKRREAEQAAQKRLHEMTDRLNGQLEAQASAITESSAAIEEMIANTRSVNNTLSKNAANVKGLQEAAEVGHSGLSEVAADISEIARESESLLEINAVMQNIASQTNLLSMNAAIEAAHAGDSGKGFAVVADEIRKLAESSSRQSKTISAVLKKIKGAIDKITRSTDGVLGKFEAIDDGVKTVAEQESGILNAMTEQSAGSAQIMQAIAQVNDITVQVKDDARQMVEAAAKLGA